jgi:hypothetical protein
MGNGDCPVGAKALAQNDAQDKEIAEVKGRLSSLEKCVQQMAIRNGVLAWQVAAIMAGLLILFETFAKPAIANVMNIGGQ